MLPRENSTIWYENPLSLWFVCQNVSSHCWTLCSLLFIDICVAHSCMLKASSLSPTALLRLRLPLDLPGVWATSNCPHFTSSPGSTQHPLSITPRTLRSTMVLWTTHSQELPTSHMLCHPLPYVKRNGRLNVVKTPHHLGMTTMLDKGLVGISTWSPSCAMTPLNTYLVQQPMHLSMPSRWSMPSQINSFNSLLVWVWLLC